MGTSEIPSDFLKTYVLKRKALLGIFATDSKKDLGMSSFGKEKLSNATFLFRCSVKD